MNELITGLRYLLLNSRRVSVLSHKRQLHSSLLQCRSVHLSSNSERFLFRSKTNCGSPVQQQCGGLGHRSGNFNSLTLVRNIGLYRKIFKKPTPDKYRERDNVGSQYDLIYEGKSASYALWGFGFVEFVALSCFASVFSLPLTLSFIKETYPTIYMEAYEFGIFVAVNSVICAFLARTCKIYVLRMYYSELEDNFIIVFMGHHPFAIQKVHVKPGEVSPVTASAIKEACLPWANDIYAIGSKQMIAPLVGFASPHYFNKLLGYEI